MSFPQNGESTFPDSRNPVRMDTEDQSFAGKPKHEFGSTTHGATHGMHHTGSNTNANTNPSSTAATAGSNTTSTGNTSTYTETMPLTGAPLVHHVHRDDEPLPGAKGGAKTFDYSPENIDQARDLPTGSGESQPFRSGEHTSAGNTTTGTGFGTGAGAGAGVMGDHANTARAYGGSTTEGSGDFRGPTLGSGTTGTTTHGTHNTGTHGTTHDSSRVSQPVGDLKPHTGNNNNNHGRTDNYNTVSATGNHHDSTHPSHHTGTGTGTANKTPYDGAGNEPTNKASIGDKIIGKTEQIAGKIANKPALQEKGEMRQAGIN